MRTSAEPLALVRSARFLPANASRLILPLGMVVYAFIVAAVVLLDTPVTYRAPIVLTFVILGPGAAFVLLLDLVGLVMRLTLVLTISLALGILVPSLMVYAGWWSPAGAIVVLALITATASATAFVLELRRRRPRTAP